MITDPQAIVYCNEVVRVKAEQVRALAAEIDACLLPWYAGLNSTIVNSGAESVEDGRENEGVSRLTGANVHNLMAVLVTLKNALDQAGVAEIVSLPCVRPLRVA